MLDTNVVLRMVSQLPDDEFRADLRALLGSGAQLSMTQQTLFEFWAVFTRPAAANGMGGTPNEAFRIIGLLRAVFEVLSDPSDLLNRWLDLCKQCEISGKPAHDARQVAVAIANGITQIVTFDPGHFSRLTNMTIIDPSADTL